MNAATQASIARLRMAEGAFERAVKEVDEATERRNSARGEMEQAQTAALELLVVPARGEMVEGVYESEPSYFNDNDKPTLRKCTFRVERAQVTTDGRVELSGYKMTERGRRGRRTAWAFIDAVEK